MNSILGLLSALENLFPSFQQVIQLGESVHIVSNGKYDFWTWVPQMLDWIGTVDEFYCSTWTLARSNCVELIELWDSGRIPLGKVSFLTGLYFKRRETATYSFLLEAIRQRGGRYIAFTGK